MSTSLLIVVPVHQEEGWSAPSNVEAKARLESHLTTPKSPEELKVAEERAHVLHQLHVDAVKRRAQRDLERVAEAERRRLHIEAAMKQRLAEKVAQSEKKLSLKRESQEMEAAEKRARRERLREAFFAARADMAMSEKQREVMLAERHANAASKRDKLLQATVNKAQFEVKHAIAVAAATKEKERTSAEEAGATLDAKLAAASERRLDLLHSPPKSSLASPPKSPHTSTAKKSSRARARQVAQLFNEQSVTLEFKRKKLCEAMDKALAARNARLDATIRRAAAYKEKMERARDAKEAQQNVEELAHQICEKGQAAAVRRMLHLKATVKKPSPQVITVPFQRHGVPAPPHLVERLSAVPSHSADAIAARHRRAAEARASQLFSKLSKLSSQVARVEAAKARRAAATRALATKTATKAASAARLVAEARSRRVSRALSNRERLVLAAVKRVTLRSLRLGAMLEKTQRRHLAATAAAATPPPTAVAARAAKVAARRAEQDGAVLARGKALAEREARAHARRASLLSGRVAMAKMSAIRRSQPAKLAVSAEGGVNVVESGETEDKEDAVLVNSSKADEATGKGLIRSLVDSLLARVIGC
ncbi:hypothetical protein AB1Y20_009750 [Prymnesium parvum]|uniref:Uncharacterized protein n=1 Tax=Prymnesium parvum TaxID=97485 RepID=A0AB34K5Z6_PRYPA